MIYAVGVAVLCVCLIIFKSSKHFFKSLFTSALGGIGALCAVKAVSLFIPLSLGINIYSLLVSAFLSVPGVIMMLVVQVLI